MKQFVRNRAFYIFIGLTTLLAACSGGGNDDSARPSGDALAFQMQAGGQTNAFFRQGNVAAHLLMRSSTKPRLLVVFPAGNSGTGLWYPRYGPARRLDP